MRVVQKPWGEEWWFAQTDRYAGKILFVRRGYRLSLQYHRVKHETQMVWDGQIKMEIGPGPTQLETRILGPTAVTPIPPGTYHRIEALEDSHILEVSTPELDDVVRVSDDFGREGTSQP